MLKMPYSRAVGCLFVAAAALGAQGCASDQQSDPAGMMAVPGGLSNIGDPVSPPPVRAELTVCSFTQDGNYTLTVNGVELPPFFILADECSLARTNTTGATEQVIVTQVSQSGFGVDSVVKTGLIGAVSSPGTIVSRANTSVSAPTMLGNEFGVVVTYWNTF